MKNYIAAAVAFGLLTTQAVAETTEQTNSFYSLASTGLSIAGGYQRIELQDGTGFRSLDSWTGNYFKAKYLLASNFYFEWTHDRTSSDDSSINIERDTGYGPFFGLSYDPELEFASTNRDEIQLTRNVYAAGFQNQLTSNVFLNGQVGWISGELETTQNIQFSAKVMDQHGNKLDNVSDEFMQYLVTEIGYVPNRTYGNTVDLKGSLIACQLGYDFKNNWLGYITLSREATTVDTGYSEIESKDTNYGIGFEYNAWQALSIQIEYQKQEDSSMSRLGVAYHW